MAYFGTFVVSFLENDSKTPEFWVVGLGIVLLKLVFRPDTEIKPVPEWLCVIAASLRSVKKQLVGQKVV